MRLGNYLKIAQSALQTEQGRQAGRRATDGLAAMGNKLTHGKYADTIEKARSGLSKQLGGPSDGAGGTTTPKG